MKNLSFAKNILLPLLLVMFGLSSVWGGTLPDRANKDFVQFNGTWYSVGGNEDRRKVSNDIRISHDKYDDHSWDWIVDRPGFSKRYGHEVYVKDRKIWVDGGYDRRHRKLHDKWYSEDGYRWHKHDDSSSSKSYCSCKYQSLPHRANKDYVYFRGYWYSVGGNDENRKVSNDIRRSRDKYADRWCWYVDKPGFSKRYGHYVYLDRVNGHDAIVVGGGYDKHHNRLHDKWYSHDGCKWHRSRR